MGAETVDLVVTGASRGLGRALVSAVHAARPGVHRFVLSARPGPALEDTAAALRADGAEVEVVPGDLSRVRSAEALGHRLAEVVRPGAIGVANAGWWPTARRIGPDELEVAWVVNALSLRPTWEPLLRARHLTRLLGIGAGLMVRGRFDERATPVGADFGRVATYCNTKLGGAVVLRDLAAEHPEVDVLVCHPGVVDTGLGAEGWLSWPLQGLKRLFFERPEAAGERLARILAAPRWAEHPGEAAWWHEERPQPWPPVASDPALRDAVRRAVTAGLHEVTRGTRPTPA